MRFVLIIATCAVLAACGMAGGSRSNVKGVGSGGDDFKKSPCACGPVIEQPNIRHAS